MVSQTMDIHAERAEREGTSRSTAKIRNYGEGYGMGAAKLRAAIFRTEVVSYLVFLRSVNMWLGENRHWVEKRDDAKRFETFAEAESASDGYDVLIKTEEPKTWEPS